MGVWKEVLSLLMISMTLTESTFYDETLVPSLLWSFKNPGDVKLSTNTLHNYDTGSYSTRLQKIIKSSSPLLLCFVEPILSVEDFSTKPESFVNLQNEVSNSKFVDYLASVRNPLDAVRLLGENNLRVKEISMTDPVDSHIDDTDILIIKLVEEYDIERVKVLKKHDKYIAETYQRIFEQRKNVIGMLTGEMSSINTISTLIRYRRAADNIEAENQSSTLDFSASGKNGAAMLVAYETPELYTSTGSKYLLPKVGSEVKLDDRNDFQRLIIFFYPETGGNIGKLTVRLRFDKETADKWSLKLIEVDSASDIKANLTLPKGTISAAMGKSFSTKDTVEFTSQDSTKLVFPGGLRVQPWMINERFGDTGSTTTFFTAAIVMGIFVMAILAAIFTMGLIMIMDIKTMDRFDDSKGKTITINVVD